MREPHRPSTNQSRQVCRYADHARTGLPVRVSGQSIGPSALLSLAERGWVADFKTLFGVNCQ